MTSDTWHRIESLYLDASALPPSGRADFLDHACEGQPALRSEVESLLEADRARGDFLDLPPARLAADLLNNRPERPGFIGQYRLLSVLGEGGMGIVYRAEQQTPHRIVALKVIREDMISSGVRRRFQLESEALGRLQHPGIAQIYDAGTFESACGAEPYFAMELIKGRPLMAYASARSLDSCARLELMAKICDAVQHAHHNGILHRDLKPGNVLVDESGQPKILDFGVARIIDSDTQLTRQTDVGQIIGTLDYMSPEQTLGDPAEMDMRSDVYSLGVILYELLAGRLPYGSKQHALPDVVRVIREHDPEPLSMIQRSYRGDIEVIAAKALEKDRERRYASAAEMAADIRRHLANEPIVARPASASYRAAKFIRRYRTLVLVTGIAGLLILAFGVSMAVLAVKYARERDAAETARAHAQQVSYFLSSLFQGADPFRARGRTLTARDLLDEGSARIYQYLNNEIAVRADLLDTIATSYQHIGALDRAEEMFTALIADRDRLDGPQSVLAARAHRMRGDVRRQRGELRAAEDDLRLALAILGKTPDTNGREWANALNNLGLVLQAEGKVGESCQLFERAAAMSGKIPGEIQNTLTMMDNWGAALADMARYPQAERVLREVLERRRKLLGGNHPQVPRSMMHLGRLLVSEGRYAEAETMLLGALDGLRRTEGPEHSDVITTTSLLGQLALDLGRTQEAEARFREALEMGRRVLGPTHVNVAGIEANLAVAFMERGDPHSAEPLLRDALAICRKSSAPTRHTADVLADYGRLLVREKRLAEAEPMLTESLALRQAQYGKSNPVTARSMVDLAALRVAQKRCEEGIALSRDALVIDRQFLPEGHALVAAAAAGSARALAACGR